MNKHTATPLTIQHFYKDHNQRWEIKDNKDNFLARCFDYESAAYIVRCVNSHEAYKALAQSIVHDGPEFARWRIQEAKRLLAGEE